MTSYDALVLAGGSARRLGGIDKPGLVVGAASLLEHVLAAVLGAERTLVVGPARATSRPVLWAREEPAGGGPVAALAAGLAHVTSDRVALLAADLPFLDAATVQTLVDAGGQGAMLVDDTGRDQVLTGAWSSSALRAALPEMVDGARLRDIFDQLDVRRIRSTPTPGRPAPWTDCDTDEDLRRARAHA